MRRDGILRRLYAAIGLAALVPLGGCSHFVPLRLGVGPTVDTRGIVGCEVRLSTGLAIGDETGPGASITGSLGSGIVDADHRPMLRGELELAGHYQWEAVTLRGGLLLGGLGTLKGDATDWGMFGLGLNLAALGRLGSHRLHTGSGGDVDYLLGAEVQAEYFFDPTNGRAIFFAPLVLEMQFIWGRGVDWGRVAAPHM